MKPKDYVYNCNYISYFTVNKKAHIKLVYRQPKMLDLCKFYPASFISVNKTMFSQLTERCVNTAEAKTHCN